MTDELDRLLVQVRACRLCEDTLPLGPKPVLQLSATARVLVVGQAPGIRVHETGLPFNDPSGDRLRNWMGVDRPTFYDASRIALVPMAFCYPGTGESGDLPPPPICANTWRTRLLDLVPNLRFTLLCGRFAIDWHLQCKDETLSSVVRRWRELGGRVVPVPHPSGRNNGWLAKNPWFERQVVPEIRQSVYDALATRAD